MLTLNNYAMRYTQEYIDKITYGIIGCAIEVHKNLGPGLLESVYEKCFLKELLDTLNSKARYGYQ